MTHVRSRLAAAFIMASLASACASTAVNTNAEPIDGALQKARQQNCGRDMKLECYKHMSQPYRCSCVTSQELEKILSDF